MHLSDWHNLPNISGQQLRNRQVVENYVGNYKYVSKRNLILHRSMFNMDFIFHTVPQKHIAIDWICLIVVI